MSQSSRLSRRPILLSLSVLAVVLIYPLLWLLDRFSGQCADGLCNFGTGLLIIAAGLLSSLVLAIIGWMRGERPRWIPLLSLAALLPMGRLLGAF